MSSTQEQCEIKCKNYEVCNATLSKLWYFCSGSSLCNYCHNSSGELNVITKEVCSMCSKRDRCVASENNIYCIKCFKHYIFIDKTCKPYVEDWYPNIDNEFFTEPYNKKWIIKYPLLTEYFIALKKWYEYE